MYIVTDVVMWEYNYSKEIDYPDTSIRFVDPARCIRDTGLPACNAIHYSNLLKDKNNCSLSISNRVRRSKKWGKTLKRKFPEPATFEMFSFKR